MCSVARNFSKLAICFIVRTCVRCNTVSSEHATSGATTYSFASMSGGAHGRIETGGAGAGTALALALNEAAVEARGEFPAGPFGAPEAFADVVEAATTLPVGASAALSSATTAAFASFADGSA